MRRTFEFCQFHTQDEVDSITEVNTNAHCALCKNTHGDEHGVLIADCGSETEKAISVKSVLLAEHPIWVYEIGIAEDDDPYPPEDEADFNYDFRFYYNKP